MVDDSIQFTSYYSASHSHFWCQRQGLGDIHIITHKVTKIDKAEGLALPSPG
jgi:hypothetical protein